MGRLEQCNVRLRRELVAEVEARARRRGISKAGVFRSLLTSDARLQGKLARHAEALPPEARALFHAVSAEVAADLVAPLDATAVRIYTSPDDTIGVPAVRVLDWTFWRDERTGELLASAELDDERRVGRVIGGEVVLMPSPRVVAMN